MKTMPLLGLIVGLAFLGILATINVVGWEFTLLFALIFCSALYGLVILEGTGKEEGGEGDD